VRCTAEREGDLFRTVLAGLGQCGVILRATFRLVEAAPCVRVYRLTYPAAAAMLTDPV
jgi:cytokinin dehydrogenase